MGSLWQHPVYTVVTETKQLFITAVPAYNDFHAMQHGNSLRPVFSGDPLLRMTPGLAMECTTIDCYRSSIYIETIARNCLVFEKIAFMCTHFGWVRDSQTNKRTNEQMDSSDA